MQAQNVNQKMATAIKWSGMAEVIAKLIQPISNMVLARLLTPNAFGIVATINIIISFADMFTDAGFQKYIIQHNFSDEEDLRKSLNVAFWSNLILSIVLWIIIFVFRDALASLVGNPGLGNILAIASLVLPVTSFSSIQIGYLKRKFRFKAIFKARIVTVLVPVFVTVPSAIILRSYWALIIGTMTVNIVNAIILTLNSDWKPHKYYSVNLLRNMISFSCWTLLEQFFIWLTAYIGTFIVGQYLNSYYVGLYKTSMLTVNQIMAIITSATLPVLFAGLSRLQNDRNQFVNTFYTFQKMIAMFVLPMSVGIYLYRNLVTQILLGSQWMEATSFIGLWGLMSGLTIIFGHYSSEVYRALGKPKLSVLSQGLHLSVLIPTLVITAQEGYEVLYIARSLVRFQAIFIDLIIMWLIVKISPIKMISNISKYIVVTIGMALLSTVLQNISVNVIWSFMSILICILFYFGALCLSNEERKMIFKIVGVVKRRIAK